MWVGREIPVMTKVLEEFQNRDGVRKEGKEAGTVSRKVEL